MTVETTNKKEELSVYSAPLPFSNLRTQSYAPVGSTVEDIVNLTLPVIHRNTCSVVVIVNGEIVPLNDWQKVVPEVGAIVNIKVMPQGGGGGKNPLRVIFTIAVMIAAPYVGAAFGTSLGLGVLGNGVLTAAQTALFNGIVSAGFGLVANLAINALCPPASQNSSKVTNPSESQTQFIEGATNAFDPYGVVPVNLGRNRMFPKQCASAYTESLDSNQFIRQMFTWGFGEQIRISDIRLGDTPITDFTDYEIEHNLTGTLHEGMNLYSNRVVQDNYNVLLSSADDYTSRNVAVDCSEAIIDVTFPSGLCKFDDSGQRRSYTVQVEAQYSLVGEDVWSIGNDYQLIAEQTLQVEAPAIIGNYTYYVYMDANSGSIGVGAGPGGIYTTLQDVTNLIKIAELTIVRTSSTQVMTVTDARSSSLYGVNLQSSASCVPSKTDDTHVTISSGYIKPKSLSYTGATAEALRKTIRFKFPTKDDYKIRIKRITADSEDDSIIDDVYLTAVRGIEYTNPIVLEGICGTALRIKATDQLNGTVNELNAIVENAIPDYDSVNDEWVMGFTRNPASIYRYVLQGLPNAKALADDEIDIDCLESWHTYCATQGYTYDRVIDYDASVEDILRDVAAAGAASPAIFDNKRGVVIDREKDEIVQIITPRNSWNYSGEMVYPTLPHAFRVQFRNAEEGYLQDERIVPADGYTEETATLFEVLELSSCTDKELAWKLARRYLATAKLRPETHSFMMDVENLVAVRGDRIKLEHDIPLIGIGDGRIKEVTYNSAEEVVSITLDNEVAFPATVEDYYVRIRLADGTQIYRQLSNAQETISNELVFFTPLAVDSAGDAPQIGDLVYVTISGGELDLIITKIEPQADLTAKLTCINYAPEIFTAETGTIPAFSSNITVPLSMQRPQAPILVEIQSGVNSALRNIDGSYLTRAIITLTDNNPDPVTVDVQVRRSGDTQFTTANILEARSDRVILTGLDDGWYYDIWIRYKRQGEFGVVSEPLEINSYKFVGLSGKPSDVTNFKVSVVNRVAFFDWDTNQDINFDHYVVRYNNSLSGADWFSSGIVKSNLTSNSFSSPFELGTYLIKAVNIYGEESDTPATVIISIDEGFDNVIATITEDPTFAGVKDNVEVVSDSLRLDDPSLLLGYYYFDNDIDLGQVYTSYISLAMTSRAIYNNDLFDEADLFLTENMYLSEDMEGSWSVNLEYRITDDDPVDSGAEWTEWLPFLASSLSFRAIEFRVKLQTNNSLVWPIVDTLSVSVDMPDRIERGEDLTVSASGATINYINAFMQIPALSILLQDATSDDVITDLVKTDSGFSFKVYNTISASYVERTFDYIASGYGKKIVVS